MKVKMKARTYFNGQRLEIGKTVDVEAAVAARWTNADIAEICEDEKPAIKKTSTKE